MVKLGVNIDHIATLRQARKENEPDVLKAALLCEKAGAEAITVHLREDRRHIQDKDVYLLKKNIKTRLNLEMSVAQEIVKIALDVNPDDVCIVPEKRNELTTEGGLDVINQKTILKEIIEKLKRSGIRVSLFINPEIEQVNASAEVGADCVELHTGKYAISFKNKLKDVYLSELKRLKEAGEIALKKGLILNAGHGLDYENVKEIAEIKGMNELNIGFSIVSKAVFVGLEKAVNEMKDLIRDNSHIFNR
ncbi:MAG: pyridoxine 5'-phosphate synthase [Elusimicrobia bacterium]|nr:pyridoxine 5'-phosphate synthase [Elusimicrobiota bacterium]